MNDHQKRKHSKFSASGAERWFNCPGSVALSEGLPDKETVWSIEGTKAHEVHETLLKTAVQFGFQRLPQVKFAKHVPAVMVSHGMKAVSFLTELQAKHPGSDILVETRVVLDFIHPEMFGTFDSAVVEHFGTLHVYDYKYGAGHAVSPVKNLQMIFYALGLAHLFDWNFKRVRLWINQPRVKSFEGPLYWEISIAELKKYVRVFEKAVKNVEKFPGRFTEGPWCHFCKAKGKCPLKQQGRLEKAMGAFANTPITR